MAQTQRTGGCRDQPTPGQGKAPPEHRVVGGKRCSGMLTELTHNPRWCAWRLNSQVSLDTKWCKHQFPECLHKRVAGQSLNGDSQETKADIAISYARPWWACKWHSQACASEGRPIEFGIIRG